MINSTVSKESAPRSFVKFDGKDDYFCFHAGTKFDDNGDIVTNGGRVLGITAALASLDLS